MKKIILILSMIMVLLTGTLSFIGRSEASAILENECGAKMSSSVSKKTDLVIVGDNAGSKLDKAKANGVNIIYSVDTLFN